MNSCAAPFGAFLRLSANYRRPGVWTAMQSTSCGSCVVLKHPHPLKPPFPARETKAYSLVLRLSASRRRGGSVASACWRFGGGVCCALVAAATLRCGVSGSGGARRFCLFCWWVRPPWLSSCLRARAFCWFPPFSVRLSLEAQLLMPPAAISCAVDASQHHIGWCNCFGQFGSGSTHTASLSGSVGPFKGT